MITADSEFVKVWDIESTRAAGTIPASKIIPNSTSINSVKRDPHNSKSLGATIDESVAIFDVRTEGKCLSFLAHED